MTRVVEIEQVVATHRPEWGKWPDTNDGDYASIFAQRWESAYRREDVEIRVRSRFYPVYSAYAGAGDRNLPSRYPGVNNLRQPSEAVMAQQRRDLSALSAAGCRAILWEHALQCFRPVVADLASLFPLRILSHADDCPGSSEVKTFPIAHAFNALYYSMLVWDARSGALTADEYKKRGLGYARHCPNTTTTGLVAGLADVGFSIERKQDLIRRGQALPHLAHVGVLCGGERGQVVQGLRERAPASLQMKLHGDGMPDGRLEPFDPPHPRGLAYPMASLYASALASFNVPVSSIFNCRLPDLFAADVAQFVYDPWGELERVGFADGEHYLKFNGTADDLIGKVEGLRSRPGAAAELVGRAHAKAQAYWAENSPSAAYADIYFKYLDGAL